MTRATGAVLFLLLAFAADGDAGGRHRRPADDGLRRHPQRQGVLEARARLPAGGTGGRRSGTVTVQVTIDEAGAVAEAVGGHTLLHAAAVKAVRRWRFTPTYLSGRPVKVTGTVVVNFLLP